MTKEEHKRIESLIHERIELLIHDIKRHQSYLNKNLDTINLSICIDDILEILSCILDKFPDEEESKIQPPKPPKPPEPDESLANYPLDPFHKE